MKENYNYLRKESLEKEIRSLSRLVARFPEGTIVANKVNGKYRFYHQQKVDGKYKRRYLDSNERKMAEKLAAKMYLSNMFKDKSNELKSLNAYLGIRKTYDYKAMLRKDSPYHTLLSDDQWEYEEYEKKTDYPEELVHDAPKGEKVRSKSEANIANVLFESGIPYRYECVLMLDGKTIHPDFTIKWNSASLIIWEHFGMMDDPKYVQKTINKLRTYFKNGYLPGVNLIMTFESGKHPLSIPEVKRVIMHYFFG